MIARSTAGRCRPRSFHGPPASRLFLDPRAAGGRLVIAAIVGVLATLLTPDSIRWHVRDGGKTCVKPQELSDVEPIDSERLPSTASMKLLLPGPPRAALPELLAVPRGCIEFGRPRVVGLDYDIGHHSIARCTRSWRRPCRAILYRRRGGGGPWKRSLAPHEGAERPKGRVT